MTRYFMSIHEAAELIAQAGALSEGGDLFLLEMGKPLLIRDLAENMIRLAGFTIKNDENPEGDVEIITSGIRPGEKMFEELFYDENSATSTQHPKILRASADDSEDKDIDRGLKELAAALTEQNEKVARRILFEFIQ